LRVIDGGKGKPVAPTPIAPTPTPVAAKVTEPELPPRGTQLDLFASQPKLQPLEQLALFGETPPRE
jgi:hypothetical protein